jgi:hypothetical protein
MTSFINKNLECIFFNLCESDSCVLYFINELNLIDQRLIGFVVLFSFIRIVLVPWDKFLLCHTSIRSILIF